MKVFYWIIGIVVVGGIGAYWYLQQPPTTANLQQQSPGTNTNLPANNSHNYFSEIDMERGWYYGLSYQKKIGTPDNWVNTGGSSKGEMWYDPARPIR